MFLIENRFGFFFLKNVSPDIKKDPIKAGTTRFIIHNTSEAEMIPRLLSDNNPIKNKEIDPRTPISVKATVGTIASTKNDKLIIAMVSPIGVLTSKT